MSSLEQFQYIDRNMLTENRSVFDKKWAKKFHTSLFFSLCIPHYDTCICIHGDYHAVGAVKPYINKGAVNAWEYILAEIVEVLNVDMS